MAIVFNEIG